MGTLAEQEAGEHWRDEQAVAGKQEVCLAVVLDLVEGDAGQSGDRQPEQQDQTADDAKMQEHGLLMKAAAELFPLLAVVV